MQFADYSWSRPTKEQLAPFDGVLRYLEGGGSRPDLTAEEVKTLHSWGKRIALIWQRGTLDAAGTFDEGAQVARAANMEADKLGAPMSSPIYYAVDSDLAPATVTPYFDGIRSVAGRPVGIYGSYKLMEWASTVGIGHRWQARGWDYGKGVHPAAQLHQVAINVDLGGATIDKNDVYEPAIPTWNPPAPPPPPTTTTPTGVTVASSCETVLWRGALVCKHSVHKYEATAKGTGASFFLKIIQGAYSFSVKASFGTHGAGGVVDEELDPYPWSVAVMVDKVFRKNMLLHWVRWWAGNHHGHSLDPDCPNLAPAAVAQFIEFGKGGDGLVGDLKDPGDKTYVSQLMARFNARRGVKNRVMLIQRGLGLTVDGYWGPQTDAAIAKVRAAKTTGVRAVQTGLLTLADGKWGPATDAAYLSLRAAAFNKTTTTAPAPAPAPAPAIDKTLPYGPFPYPNGPGSVYGPSTAGKNWWSGKVGSKTVSVTQIRANIKRIQKACKITQDGMYGPVTAKAVAAWQKSHKLYVDGLVGPQTWNSM